MTSNKPVNMADTTDMPLHFHESFSELLDSFRNVIAALTWLKVSGDQAQTFFSNYPYVIELTCTSTDKLIKIDKSIFSLVQKEGFNKATPLYSKTLIDFYRVLTIAVKDIAWQEPVFRPFLRREELQFLKHIRNASAHHNKFFFGSGRQRQKIIRRLPISWRGNLIEEKLEGTQLYMEFMAPGDLFVLLSDISVLVRSSKP